MIHVLYGTVTPNVGLRYRLKQMVSGSQLFSSSKMLVHIKYENVGLYECLQQRFLVSKPKLSISFYSKLILSNTKK